MIADLVAGTDTATCVVFDPSALTHLHAVEWDQFWGDGGDREATVGNLVLLETPSDGTYKLRVYVEEAAPPELISRAFHAEPGRLLRVPGGRLCAGGLEHVPLKDARSPAGSAVQLAAGDYRVDGYLIEPDEADTRIAGVDRLTGWGCLGTVLLAPLALLFLSTNDWVFQPPSIAIAALLVLFWVPLLLWRRRPAQQAAQRQLADAQTPSLVLVLSRLDDATDRRAMKGLLLRPAVIRSEPPAT